MFDDDEEIELRSYPPTGHFPDEPLAKLPALIDGRNDDDDAPMYGWSYEETDAGIEIKAGESSVALYPNIDEQGDRYVAITGDRSLAQTVQQVIETDPLLFGEDNTH